MGCGVFINIFDGDFYVWFFVVDRILYDWCFEMIEWVCDGNVFYRFSGVDIGDEGVWLIFVYFLYYILFNVVVGGNWLVSFLIIFWFKFDSIIMLIIGRVIWISLLRMVMEV